MNRKQRTLLKISLGLALLIGLFPPWNFVVSIPRSGNEIKRWAGYASLFSPPVVKPTNEDEPNTGWPSKWVGVEISLPALFAEWITVVLATGGLYLLLGRVHIPESRWPLTPASQSKKPN